ncbi:MAG: CHAT domain-containing protein [Planctomycetes bacterium]|nr:CHAT domain-containing protein [Planctomycetota bacterium]
MMRDRHGLSPALACVAVIAGSLPAQDPREALIGEIATLYRQALHAHETNEIAAVRAECAKAYDRLRMALPVSTGIQSLELARAGHALAETGWILGRSDAEIVQDLEAEWAVLERLPAPRHGAVLLLDVLSKRLYGLGRAGEVADRLCLAVRGWPCNTPMQAAKRVWLAVGVARSLLNRCRRPDLADNLLSWAMADLQIQSPWPERLRRQLVADEELWIVDRERLLAGDPHDCRGELHLMRAFARVSKGVGLGQHSKTWLAAEDEFRRRAIEHRLADVRLDLAVLWLRLGSMERAESEAMAARKYYEQRHGANDIDHNGVLAMDKVLARVALARGEPKAISGRYNQLRAQYDPARAQQTNADLCVLLAELQFAMRGHGPNLDAMDELITASLAAPWLRDNRRVRARLLHLRVRRQVFGGDSASARAALAQAGVLVEEDQLLGAWQQALLADVARADNEHAEALRCYAAAAECVQAAIDVERLWTLDGTLEAFQQLHGVVVDGALSSFLELQAADPGGAAEQLPRLFGIIEGFRDGGMTFGSAASMPQHALDPHAAAERARLVMAFDRDLGRKASPGPLAVALRHRLRGLNDELADLDLRRLLAGPSQSRDLPRSLPQLQQGLAQGEVFLEFLCFGDRCAALCIDASGADLVPIELTKDESQWFAKMRERTAEDELGHSLPAIAQALRASPKLVDYIDRAEVLLLSPEGPFAAVPFAALPWSEARLGEHKVLAWVASPSDLVRLRDAHPQAPPPSGRLLALGNPLGKNGVSLPASGREVVAIARLFAAPIERDSLEGARFTLLLGAEATRERLMRECRSDVRFLHLACYATVDTEYSPLSYLALSDDAQGNPGFLHTWDFERLAGDYELVALSSCQTGIGPVRGHSAPASLVRAAQAAGARRVLGTLWPVDDKEAADLVIRFYELWLKEGEGCAAALAHAQREAIARGAPVRAWAGFCLWGEPR